MVFTHDRVARDEPRLRGGAPLMAAASDEQEVLKARLLAKEASLRDLTKRYLQFVNGVEGKSAEECGVLYQGLLKEIARYEFAVSKARSLIETNTRQVADYDQMRQVGSRVLLPGPWPTIEPSPHRAVPCSGAPTPASRVPYSPADPVRPGNRTPLLIEGGMCAA